MISCCLGYGPSFVTWPVEIRGGVVLLPKTREFSLEKGKWGLVPGRSMMLGLVFILSPQFDGAAREELQQVAAQFCSYQSIALELIKTKQRKESRFQLFMQVCPWPASAFPRLHQLHLNSLPLAENIFCL